MKKFISLLLIATFLIAIFAGCGAANNAPGTETQPDGVQTTASVESTEKVQEEPKVLRITSQSWIPSKYKLYEAVERFKKDHPGVEVTVNLIDNMDTSSYILQWSQGKTNADLCLGGIREYIDQYAAKGFLVDFNNDFYDDTLKKEDFIPTLLEMSSIEGKQYMLPLLGEIMYLVVNKNLMKAAGLTDEKGNVIPPKTWEELYDYARKTTVVKNGKAEQYGLGIDFQMDKMPYLFLASLQGTRGDIYTDDKLTLDFKSEEAKKLLTMWKKLVSDGYTPIGTFADPDANRTSFKSGNLAMHMTAASRWIEAGALLGSNNVTVMPIPGTENKGTVLYTEGVYIPKLSPAQNLAKQFIKEQIMQADFFSYNMNLYGKIPPLQNVYESALAPEWAGIKDAAGKVVISPLYREWPKLTDVWVVEFQKALTGKQSIEESLANVDKAVNAIDKTTGVE